MKMERTTMRVDAIKRPIANPNKMSDHIFKSLVEGIKKDGFVYPVVVRLADNRIVDGDHRYLAAVECGLEEIPVILVDIDQEQAFKLGVGLNQKRGDLDMVELKNVIFEYMPDKGNLGMELGFTDAEVGMLLESVTLKEGEQIGIPDMIAGEKKEDLPKPNLNTNYPVVFFCQDAEERKTIMRYFKDELGEPSTQKLLALIKAANGT